MLNTIQLTYVNMWEEMLSKELYWMEMSEAVTLQ